MEGFISQQTTAMNREDQRELIAAIECPALVLCGEQDGVMPPVRSEEMAILLKGEFEMVLVVRAGHLAPLKQLNAVVPPFSRWLRKVDAAER